MIFIVFYRLPMFNIQWLMINTFGTSSEVANLKEVLAVHQLPWTQCLVHGSMYTDHRKFVD